MSRNFSHVSENQPGGCRPTSTKISHYERSKYLHVEISLAPSESLATHSPTPNHPRLQNISQILGDWSTYEYKEIGGTYRKRPRNFEWCAALSHTLLDQIFTFNMMHFSPCLSSSSGLFVYFGGAFSLKSTGS